MDKNVRENMIADTDKLIGTKQAARILHVSTSTIQRWLDMDFVKTYKTVGGHRRAKKKDLVAFAGKLGLGVLSSEKEVPPEVLIVDDDKDIVVYLKRFIKTNYPLLKVDSAKSGFEAGIKLSKLEPMLVLLDLRMPGMNGIEVCRIIKEKLKRRSMRIVGITVSRVKGELEEFRRAGAADILLKPFNLKKLRRCVDNIISPSMPGK